MTRVIQHIRLGESNRAWCGLYTGFHNPRPVIIESDYTDRLARGRAYTDKIARELTASVCLNCRRSFDAAERKVTA